MAEGSAQKVSVLVPAYNASATIDETLLSIRAQTHRNLEIIVVDDGSRDQTCQIVERHAAEDERVCLLAQANAGVAGARNRALASASGHYVAPVDADDLWRPDKIARQLAMALERGPAVSLVYTWYASIDGESRIRKVFRPSAEGHVLPALCAGNIVGHASSPLMRTTDVIRSGGYDASLRARAAQGCEDWQLYLKLAELGEFAVVRAPLTGYRQTEQGMSSDAAQMFRSHHLVMSEFQRAHPEHRDEFRRGQQDIARYLLRRAIRASQYRAALSTFWRACGADPSLGLDLLATAPRMLRPSKLRRAILGVQQPGTVLNRPHFLTGDDKPDPVYAQPRGSDIVGSSIPLRVAQ